MANKTGNDDTEYHLHDEEGSFEEGDVYEHEGAFDSGESEGPVNKGKFPLKPKRKLILFVVIALAAIFVVYKIFSMLFAPSPKKAQEEAAQAKTELLSAVPSAAVPPVPKAVVPIKAADEEAAKAEAPVPQMVNGRNGRIDNLQKGQNELKTMVKANQDANKQHFTSLNEKMSELSGGIENLQGSVKILSSDSRRNASSLEKLAMQRKIEKKQQEKRARLQKRYFVKAVIPGRAWLQGADGTEITVAVGDTVFGYGKVKSINSYNGVVKFDTGANIYYGISDK